MPLEICVLGSGSTGNSVYVASGSCRILIDAGLSGKETVRRLDSVGVDIKDIAAVCLTHEHDDHTSSLRFLTRRLGVPLYANAGTIEAVERRVALTEARWHVFTTGVAFAIGDISLEPFSVPHDSYDPVGFVLTNARARVGIVTDMGMTTGLIRQRLSGCTALVLESNHDTSMLQDSPRPWGLKQRIAGHHGHLSNEQAADLISEVAHEGLSAVLLAHLSAECNDPELALRAVRDALAAAGHAGVNVAVAHPDRPGELYSV